MNIIPEEFQDIVEKQQKKIFRYCFRMTGDFHAAQDIMQDAFVSCYGKYAGSGAIGNITGYIYKTAYHMCIDYLNGRKKARLVELDPEMESPGMGTEESMLSRYYNPKIEECLNALTGLQRSVLILHCVDGIDYREMSGILGKKEAALRKQYQRAKDKIESMLKRNGGAEYEGYGVFRGV